MELAGRAGGEDDYTEFEFPLLISELDEEVEDFRIVHRRFGKFDESPLRNSSRTEDFIIRNFEFLSSKL